MSSLFSILEYSFSKMILSFQTLVMGASSLDRTIQQGTDQHYFGASPMCHVFLIQCFQCLKL